MPTYYYIARRKYRGQSVPRYVGDGLIDAKNKTEAKRLVGRNRGTPYNLVEIRLRPQDNVPKPCQAVIDYWADNFIHKNPSLCGLCGNTGVIRTSPTSPAGVHFNYEAFCICPNGQIMRQCNELQKA